MNIINFTLNGGYRLKQYTLRKMQEAYIQILKVFILFCNVPETGNYIIAGCKIVGPNITAGYVYMDGDLCAFVQTAGDNTTLIKKVETVATLGFKNGTNPSVFRFTSAVVDPTVGIPLSGFTRVSPVFDANYIHTDNNFSDAQVAKLLGIEPGAQVNVSPDWFATTGMPGNILNQPTGLLSSLHNSEVYGIPDIDPRYKVTVTFPDVGTDNYLVVGSFISQSGSDWQGDCNVSWTVKDQTNTSFDLCVMESSGTSQNIYFKYMLLKLP